MNIKNIAIVLTVLLVAIAAMLLMQKGNYVDQATEHYNKTTQNTFKATSKIVEYVGNSIDVNKMVWALACEGIQTAKSSQDMAKLEAKYFPATKGSNSKVKMTRHFEASTFYFIDSKFDKVDTDKKTDVWFLNNLSSIDVSALLGLVTPAATAPSEEEEEYEE
ncbi:MAG: hypothetical protein IKX42_10500 [Fibrobacter sp.]|jgi:hypothetical protein|uniref:hypothetical protein n=1 Tax=Fibrobacter sp. UBA4309 TaxID=1946537 RepID=UPI0025B8D2FC|nr:hypothetical protein [Fibrobacter sp. UBA4309]MBR5694113.1 hypothetical protein [Fibrobacter sp.]